MFHDDLTWHLLIKWNCHPEC